MYALCLESSHQRGMGHLFRGIQLYHYIVDQKGESAVIFINQNLPAIDILKKEGIPYEEVCFKDILSDWESKLIQKYEIDIWLNDKYQTKRELFLNVKKNKGVLLAAIDEEGGHDELLDVHFVGMVFQKDFCPEGKYIFRGMDYIVLNEDIRKYQYVRQKVNNVIVSMGGSDTYGVTVKVLRILNKKKIQADVVVGPSFQHMDELQKIVTVENHVFQNVPSLIKKFSEYDMAITGGGVTCLEAAASGIPCIIVANELFEIDTAVYMENLGAAVFAGYHMQIIEERFDIAKMNIKVMSRAGLRRVPLCGAQNIYLKLQECKKKLEKVNE
ncbi:MAG: hypothetical protein K2N44_16110 [Lachnospiraceae bacterium]|nr:hypothetical protein [Lachnospiraceae bacterium]